MIIRFFRLSSIQADAKHRVFKSVSDNISFILKKNRIRENTQIETLYLLICLSGLGKNYWIEQSVLVSYFGLSIDDKKVVSCDIELNYFSISVMLLYMKDKKRYSVLRSWLESHILNRFVSRPDTGTKETELIILMFDIIACPYVNQTVKHAVLTQFEVMDFSEQARLITTIGSKDWFTSWKCFDFAAELDNKLSHEVY